MALILRAPLCGANNKLASLEATLLLKLCPLPSEWLNCNDEECNATSVAKNQAVGDIFH